MHWVAVGHTVNVAFNQHVVQHPYLAMLTSLILGNFNNGNLSATRKFVSTKAITKWIRHLHFSVRVNGTVVYFVGSL